MTDIHKVELGSGRFMWLLVDDEPYGEPLVAGPDPAGDIADALAGWFMSTPADEIYGRIRQEFRSGALIRRSLFWTRIHDSGRVEIKKEAARGTAATAPFTSPEEMKIVSAVNGWTDPEWLHDAATRAAAEIVKRQGEKPRPWRA